MTARLAVTSPGYALFAASSMNRYDYEKQGRVREAVLQDPASPKAGLVNCRSLPWPRFGRDFLGGIPHEYWVFGPCAS